MSAEGNEGFLTRSRLRDTIFVISAACALFLDISRIDIVVAFCLLSLGIFIHFVTKGVLIRNEVLCKEGIYSIVRHPYYLANFLVDSCFCLLSGSHYLLLLYPFLFFWSYGPTMREEERNLGKRYPDSFPGYALEIPRVFPDRQSIRNTGALFAGFSIKRISPKEMARIVRFCAMAILILFAGNLSQAGSFVGMNVFRQPVPDILLATAVFLYICSSVILKMGKSRAHSN